MNSTKLFAFAAVFAVVALTARSAAGLGVLPDGRTLTPVGFTIPVEGFASTEAMSPDGKWLAVLSQDGGAIDVISIGEDARLVDRLHAPWATGMTWNADGLYVTRGYTGAVSRWSYDAAASKDAPQFVQRADVAVGGLVNGIDEDPESHDIVVARTAQAEVDVVDDGTSAVTRRLNATGQPFSVALLGTTVVATLYDGDGIDVWQAGSTSPATVKTGLHPTALLVDGGLAYVANADGNDVAVVDVAKRAVTRRYDLALGPHPLTGQTPSGMALSDDRKYLFVAESGLDDVAMIDARSGAVVSRIPTGWYPMGVIAKTGTTIDKDPRLKPQLWILSAQGLGPQPDPGSEWDGWYTGIVQHLIVDPTMYGAWTQTVTADDRLKAVHPASGPLPPIRHIVFIVKENKHFDEEFGDEKGADADPTLCLYGRFYTPNAHALAERYTLFDNFMADGEKSDYGHSWTTQAMVDDYLMRNVHTPDDPASAGDRRVPGNIWPTAEAGEDAVSLAQMDFDWYRDLTDLPGGPRVNVSGVFGPRGELIDELQRKGVSYRVYGEQMTMLSDGKIASGLAGNADRDYPGAHIDFGVLDTQRAKLFLADVAAHGLAAYSYLTLPTDHTAGTKAAFYTPASYVANNDEALGEIVAGLSKRPDWRNTVVFVTMDDSQGTGDHVDSHRMPAFAIGPYVRRGHVDQTRYTIASILRTVEVVYGLDPLNMHDAAATPMTAAFASTPDVAAYTALPSNVPLQHNPGNATSMMFELDGPGSAAIPAQEWSSIKGATSEIAREDYLRKIGRPAIASDDDAATAPIGNP
jgi:YVTN family beta-propeller protein